MMKDCANHGETAYCSLVKKEFKKKSLNSNGLD